MPCDPVIAVGFLTEGAKDPWATINRFSLALRNMTVISEPKALGAKDTTRVVLCKGKVAPKVRAAFEALSGDRSLHHLGPSWVVRFLLCGSLEEVKRAMFNKLAKFSELNLTATVLRTVAVSAKPSETERLNEII